MSAISLITLHIEEEYFISYTNADNKMIHGRKFVDLHDYIKNVNKLGSNIITVHYCDEDGDEKDYLFDVNHIYINRINFLRCTREHLKENDDDVFILSTLAPDETKKSEEPIDILSEYSCLLISRKLFIVPKCDSPAVCTYGWIKMLVDKCNISAIMIYREADPFRTTALFDRVSQFGPKVILDTYESG